MRMLGKLMLGVLMTFVSTAGLAQKGSRRLVVAVDENEFLPYYQARADGSVRGFARDLLDRFAQDEGYLLDYQVYPLNRLQQLQLQQRLDLRFPDSPLWADKRKKSAQIFYSRPVVAYVDGIFQSSKTKPLVKGNFFSILRGFTPLSFTELVKEGKVHFMEAPDLRAALAMYYKQRVNGVYGNEAVLMRLNREGYDEQLVIQSQYPVTRDSYRLSSSQHKDVITQFDRWYEAKKKDIDVLLENYQLSGFRP